MKKSTPLDRADSLFHKAYVLGSDLEKEKWLKGKANTKVNFNLSMLFEKKTKKKEIDPLRWFDFRPRVLGIRKAAVSLAEWSKKTRYKDVADKVKSVWKLAQNILDEMNSLKGQRIIYDKANKPERLLSDSVRTAAYLFFSTDLCNLCREGFLAVKDARKDEEKRASDPKRWETEIQSAKADAPVVALPNKVKKGLGSIDLERWLWVLPNEKTVKLPKGDVVLSALKAWVKGKKSFEVPSRGVFSQKRDGPKNLLKVLKRTVEKAIDHGLIMPEGRKLRIKGRNLIF